MPIHYGLVHLSYGRKNNMPSFIIIKIKEDISSTFLEEAKVVLNSNSYFEIKLNSHVFEGRSASPGLDKVIGELRKVPSYKLDKNTCDIEIFYGTLPKAIK